MIMAEQNMLFQALLVAKNINFGIKKQLLNKIIFMYELKVLALQITNINGFRQIQP